MAFSFVTVQQQLSRLQKHLSDSNVRSDDIFDFFDDLTEMIEDIKEGDIPSELTVQDMVDAAYRLNGCGISIGGIGAKMVVFKDEGDGTDNIQLRRIPTDEVLFACAVFGTNISVITSDNGFINKAMGLITGTVNLNSVIMSAIDSLRKSGLTKDSGQAKVRDGRMDFISNVTARFPSINGDAAIAFQALTDGYANGFTGVLDAIKTIESTVTEDSLKVEGDNITFTNNSAYALDCNVFGAIFGAVETLLQIVAGVLTVVNAAVGILVSILGGVFSAVGKLITALNDITTKFRVTNHEPAYYEAPYSITQYTGTATENIVLFDMPFRNEVANKLMKIIREEGSASTFIPGAHAIIFPNSADNLQDLNVEYFVDTTVAIKPWDRAGSYMTAPGNEFFVRFDEGDIEGDQIVANISYDYNEARTELNHEALSAEEEDLAIRWRIECGISWLAYYRLMNFITFLYKYLRYLYPTYSLTQIFAEVDRLMGTVTTVTDDIDVQMHFFWSTAQGSQACRLNQGIYHVLSLFANGYLWNTSESPIDGETLCRWNADKTQIIGVVPTISTVGNWLSSPMNEIIAANCANYSNEIDVFEPITPPSGDDQYITTPSVSLRAVITGIVLTAMAVAATVAITIVAKVKSNNRRQKKLMKAKEKQFDAQAKYDLTMSSGSATEAEKLAAFKNLQKATKRNNKTIAKYGGTGFTNLTPTSTSDANTSLETLIGLIA